MPLDRVKNVLANSLTAVRLEPRHPLCKEIKAYQLNRIASLAAKCLQEGPNAGDSQTAFPF
jgi:hypothetical protein